MLSLLFWNTHKQPVQNRIAVLVESLNIDMLILAECTMAVKELEEQLSSLGRGVFHAPPSEATKTRLFTRLPTSEVTEKFNGLNGLTLWQLRFGYLRNLLLGVVHFPSKMNWDQNDQLAASRELAHDIARIEDDVGHQNTFLVGDFNMNPYEPGVIAAQGLNAKMTRELTRRPRKRDVRRGYRTFYNPMWGYFGDRTPGPSGSYHHASSKPVNAHWHIYDQVLLRPDVMDRLSELSIIESDGQQSMATRSGLPDRRRASDHFPILLRLMV